MTPLFRTIALAALVLALSACSQSPATGDAQVEVTKTTLDNGLKVVIVRNSLAPVATQQITYFAGGNQAPQDFPGIAHAQEHMMFRGSPGLSANQLSGIYARMGGDMNAFTTDTTTSYFFTVPAQDINVALHVGALRMKGVTNSQKQWEKERGALEQEVARDHSDALRRLIVDKLFGTLFAGTPYATSSLGTKASFGKLTASMLDDFHNTWYVPNNALLVVAGDVDPQATLKTIKSLYGSIPSKKIPANRPFQFSPVTATTFSAPSDLAVGIVIVAFRMPGYKSADYPAAALAAQALESKRGPIKALKYQGKMLAANFQMISKPDVALGLAIGVYPPGGNANAVKKALVNAIKTVRKDGIDKALVAAAKKRVVLNAELKSNSVQGLAMTWTNALTKAGLQSPQEALKRLQAVTTEQANEAVRSFLQLDHAVTVIANPTPGTKPTANAATQGKESFGSAPEGKVTLPDWAHQAFAALPQPQRFLNPTVTTLDNGLRLIVQPLHVNQSISVFGAVHQNGDLQAPKGKKGIAKLLAALFQWGPKGMSQLQFAAAQDKIGANLSIGPRFSLQVQPKSFDKGVHLLARGLLHPRLPKAAFQQQRRLHARQARGQLESPKFQFRLAVGKALVPANDPSIRVPSFKSVQKLSLTDLKNYYNKVYRPDVTTIVIMGNITPEKAVSVVKKYFGSWHAKGPAPTLDYPPIPLSKPSHIRVPDILKKQNQVVLAETLDINYTNPDHFALELARDYLSGGFYATPLYRVLRQNLGLVYNVGAHFDFQRHRSTFKLRYGSYPDKVGAARAAAIKVLNDTMAKPLTDDELHLAKSIGLRKLQLSKQSVAAIAKGWISLSQLHLPLDWSYIKARHFKNLTADELHKAMNQYIDTDRLSTIILGKPTK